ncbi:MAG: methyltransferase domain-containing protein [Bryobacteraceae bacterium]
MRIFAAFAAVFFLIPLPPAAAQATHPVSGRTIAPVMGVGGAPWLVRPEREAEEDPARSLELLGLKPGMMVGDVGCGVGYWSLRMAEKVAPGGRVYASDIQPEMLRLLRERMKKAGVTNVEPVSATETSPELPEGTLDLAIMVDVYHELSKPEAVLASIARSLKPDGRLVLLEYRKEDTWIPIREEHKMSVATVRQELEAAGYRFVGVTSDLPWQHLFVFRKPVVQ